MWGGSGKGFIVSRKSRNAREHITSKTRQSRKVSTSRKLVKVLEVLIKQKERSDTFYILLLDQAAVEYIWSWKFELLHILFELVMTKNTPAYKLIIYHQVYSVAKSMWTAPIKTFVSFWSGAVFQGLGTTPRVKGALCSSGEEMLMRRERSSSADFVLPK